MNNRGFTLIELIIALMVFATIATLTSSILYQSFQTRERITIQADRLNALQLAVTLIQRDLIQIIARPIRGNEMHLFPALIAQANYLEFTRGGAVNPAGIEQRSTLKRVAYLCKKTRLIRRNWDLLDMPNHDSYHDEILLDNLTGCAFAYLKKPNNFIPNWYPNPRNDKSPHPSAIQFNLKLKDWGPMSLLFTLPEAL